MVHNIYKSCAKSTLSAISFFKQSGTAWRFITEIITHLYHSPWNDYSIQFPLVFFPPRHFIFFSFFFLYMPYTHTHSVHRMYDRMYVRWITLNVTRSFLFFLFFSVSISLSRSVSLCFFDGCCCNTLYIVSIVDRVSRILPSPSL